MTRLNWPKNTEETGLRTVARFWIEGRRLPSLNEIGLDRFLGQPSAKAKGEGLLERGWVGGWGERVGSVRLWGLGAEELYIVE